jgi:hypothetical protein
VLPLVTLINLRLPDALSHLQHHIGTYVVTPAAMPAPLLAAQYLGQSLLRPRYHISHITPQVRHTESRQLTCRSSSRPDHPQTHTYPHPHRTPQTTPRTYTHKPTPTDPHKGTTLLRTAGRLTMSPTPHVDVGTYPVTPAAMRSSLGGTASQAITAQPHHTSGQTHKTVPAHVPLIAQGLTTHRRTHTQEHRHTPIHPAPPTPRDPHKHVHLPRV